MSDCLFCQIIAGSEPERIICETMFFSVFQNKFPVTLGHLLIVPKRHIASLFEMNEWEHVGVWTAIEKARKYLEDAYQPDGYNFGVNIGEAAGQTIFHLHLHLIPRRKGDVDDPRGGMTKFMKPLVEYP